MNGKNTSGTKEAEKVGGHCYTLLKIALLLQPPY